MVCNEYYHMGTTAENIADQFKITKDEQDEFAVASQSKTENAQKNSKFDKEIVTIEIASKKETKHFKEDEFPTHGSTFEKINSLKPVFKKDGTVTAGNASGLNMAQQL